MFRGNPTGTRSLSQLLMQRALAVVSAVLLVAAGMALLGLQDDIRDEVAAAGHLGELVAVLGRGPGLTDAALLDELQRLDQQQRLRHLTLELRRQDGSLLLAAGTQQLPAALEPLLGWLGADAGRSAGWSLARPAGPPWQVLLHSTPGGEQREAMATLVALLGLMLICAAGLLLTMRWSLRHALRPLDRLLAAISDLGRRDHATLRSLTAMPVAELESVVAAVRLLDEQLQAAQAHSRELSHKMLTLQEQERARVAHELHDELGQRLTAMRVDTARLMREQPPSSPQRAGIERLKVHCELLQREVRALLSGLQPFGPAFERDEPVSAAQLHRQLEGLIQGWRRDHGPLRLGLSWQGPTDPPEDTIQLPRELALVLFRITQEALTNVIRHAQGTSADVQLRLDLDDAGQPSCVHWSVSDDGVGLPASRQALRQGNGLAGIVQRVFAAGGDLLIEAAHPGGERPGVRLSATLFVQPVTGQQTGF